MLIGYARGSADDQTLHLQVDALQTTGCEQIFRETVSGTKSDRPELSKALEHVRNGAILVVWRTVVLRIHIKGLCSRGQWLRRSIVEAS